MSTATDNAAEVRIDKWLWVVRIFKTRSDAAEACKNNKVAIGDTLCKPSRVVKIGEIITIKKAPVIYTYKVVAIVGNRQPAKNVALYAENLTPQEELEKLNMKNLTIFVQRERGAGRPTKRDRRMIDKLMDND